MSKIKRNDPCPCGSGKKYKKCCGFHKTSNQNTPKMNDELNRIHQDFITDAINKYGDKMEEVHQQYEKPTLQGEALEIYNTGLNLWMPFHVPCFKNNETIFDVFSKKKSSALSGQAKGLFAQWKNCSPSVYEIVSKSSEQTFVTVNDLGTNETYKIPYHQGEEFSIGSLVIGILVPLADHYSFFFTIIKLYQHDKERIKHLLEQYSDGKDKLSKSFPDFLGDTLTLGMETSEWSNSLHEQVAQVFANHLVDKNIPDDILFKGVNLWKQYCEKENPSLKNVDSYAAALEYLVQKSLLNNESLTQSQLAEEYNASAGTVSTNYRKLTTILENELKK
ncbi:SEC-C motif-containing protein [Oceanobacillus limi]|uniref:SEC-C motif-containing protein n=1 Tax=Oceanobacillus limi TaxID=930131 RepID=A0A1I0A295_9BACI|nr:cyclin family protein [Oceanobacillus limi]SES88255.1 SEC-C motif-containing protein [Oceanobacillus limi]